MISPYSNCRLCPRTCGVNRDAGQRGLCGETSQLRIAFAGIHRGEEPPVTGAGGSGTIFVSGCNLGCAFCQNYQISSGNQISNGNQTSSDISQAALGRAVETNEFAEICLALQNRGAENINIVTGSHAVPAIAGGIAEARKQGLKIPVLWNSSGYDGMESLEILKDFIDVYLPDLKTLDSSAASMFFNAPDYPEHAKAAVLKMIGYRNVSYSGAAMVSGVMIRHLVLPGLLENTRQVLRWFADNCKNRALLSLMTQYTPAGVRRTIPSRYINESEYEAVVDMLDEFGIEDGFCQELVTGSEWLPDFNRPNPFSSELSVPVWHFNQRQ